MKQRPTGSKIASDSAADVATAYRAYQELSKTATLFFPKEMFFQACTGTEVAGSGLKSQTTRTVARRGTSSHSL